MEAGMSGPHGGTATREREGTQYGEPTRDARITFGTDRMRATDVLDKLVSLELHARLTPIAYADNQPQWGVEVWDAKFSKEQLDTFGRIAEEQSCDLSIICGHNLETPAGGSEVIARFT